MKTWLFALSLVAGVGAQDGEFLCLGRVVSESGRALVGATVAAFPIVPRPWMREPGDAGTATPISTATATDGRFRLQVPWSRTALIVTTEAGLGAVAAPIDAQVPIILRAAPLAAVRRADGRPLEALLRLVLDGGQTVAMGRRSGTEVLLPPARWMFLIEDHDRRVELAATLDSGARHELLLPHGLGLAMRGEGLAGVHLERWPELGDPLRGGRLPLLAAPGSAWLRWDDATGSVFTEFVAEHHAPVPTRPEGIRREIEVTSDSGAPIERARVSVLRKLGREWTLVSRSRSTADGHATLWIPSDADHLLAAVIEHEEFATGWMELAAGEDGALQAKRMVLEQGGQAVLDFTDPEGLPLSDVSARVTDPRRPMASRTERTNAYGRVVLSNLSTSARIAVESRSHLPLYDVDLSVRPGDVVRKTIVLARGGELRGSVHDPAGSPAIEVLVELRDPSGAHLRSARRATTDENGEFVFRGLPDASFVLFATASRSGHTHSARIAHARPGETEWVLVLTDEDPASPKAGTAEPPPRKFRP